MTRQLTARLRLVLDRGHHLRDFGYSEKEQSFDEIEGSPLASLFLGQTPDQILRLEPDKFCSDYSAEGDWPQFIYLKHFIALQAVIKIFAGEMEEGAHKWVIISDIRASGDRVIVEARAAINLGLDEIKGCRRCAGVCRSRRPARASFNSRHPRSGPGNSRRN